MVAFEGEIKRIRIKYDKENPDIYFFEYYKNGKKITDTIILKKIKELKIPNYWKNTSLTLETKSGILAIGYDKKNKKQYLYSGDYVTKRQLKKNTRLSKLTSNIDKLKETVLKLITSDKINLNYLIGIAISIILNCSFRIGTTKGLEKYKSTGVTTLLIDHIKINQKEQICEIKFKGKKQILNLCLITDKNIISAIFKLIQYQKKQNEKNNFLFLFNNELLSFKKINDFLMTKFKITSKDIRTWNANFLLLTNLRNHPFNDGKKERKKYLKKSIEETAKKLSHTAAICKKNYLLPYIYKTYLETGLRNEFKEISNTKDILNKLLQDIN